MSIKEPVVYGKYQLIEQLARGGMAEVFKAKAHGVEGFEKILVIKRILPDLSENRAFVDMFINEAKIAVTLSHANIVQVFDLGWAENTYFIAMEYVAGMDLSTLFRSTHKESRKRRLPLGIAVYIVSELAKGLDYAHRRRDSEDRPLNIVHRDVSPQNVLISHEGEIKLTDFGIAKARTLAQAVTELGIVKGKYAYMAPEQLQGGRIDARTDVFAAGTLLFKTLAGINPFLGSSVYETLQKIRSGNIPQVRQFVPDIPKEVDVLLSKTLAHDPDKRLPTAGSLYDELAQFLYSSGQRIGARELAEYLSKLEPVKRRKQEDKKAIQAVFESEGSTVSERNSQEIMEETRVLRGGRQSRRQTGSSQEPNGSQRTGSFRERTEWRDVVSMVVMCDEDEVLDRPVIIQLVKRFNGRIIELTSSNTSKNKKSFFILFGDINPDRRDTENAARCSFRISRYASSNAAEYGRSTTVRIVIHTGRVLISLSGELLKDDAFYELTSTSLTLAEKCEPGHVLLNRDTSRALRGRYQLISTGKKDEELFILANERLKVDNQGIFIGRRDELKRIGEILSQVDNGTPHVIGLCGEDGLGKSRLLSEILRRLGLAGHETNLHMTTLVPQMKEIPLTGIQQMLRAILGMEDDDPEVLLRDRTSRLRELGLLFKEQEAITAVLGLPSQDGKQPSEYRRLKAALQRIVEKLAEDRLTLFTWDSAEYMDDDSISIIDEILTSIDKSRIALFLCYRPGYITRWSGKDFFIEIEIEPLSDPDVARLIASRLGYEEIPIELLRDVANKCGGNPLHIEEYLIALVESTAIEFVEDQVRFDPKAANVDVPKTLRGIISARVGKLIPTTRYILQVASLAGDFFNTDTVAAAAEMDFATVSNTLSATEMKGILRQLRPSEYAFSHNIVAQVVRESLTRKAQVELHHSIAKAIESLHPERCNEMASQLAYHYQEAGDWKKSVDYLVRAADTFEVAYALDKAIENLQKAIEILTRNNSSPTDNLLHLYQRVSALSFRNFDLSNGIAKTKQAIKIAEELKAEKYLARFSLLLGKLLVLASRVKEGRHWLEQAQHIARGVTDLELSRDVLLAMASAYLHVGEYEKAVGAIKEALQLARGSENIESEISCLISLALTYSRMQDHNSAMDTLSKTISRVKDLSEPKISCKVYRLESQINHFAGNDHAAIRAASMALEVAKDAALIYECVINAYNIGNSYLHIDDYRRAFASLRYSYELAIEHGFTKLQMSNMRLLGFIDAVRFKSEQGHSQLIQAIQYAETQGDIWDIVHGKILLAIVEQNSGNSNNALKLLQEVQKTTLKHGNRQYLDEVQQALRSLDAKKPIQLPR